MAGIYFHIPFCHSKCAYCDFYSMSVTSLADEYIKAIVRELEMRIDEIAPEPVRTIYIGGGTPSSLSLSQLNMLLTSISRTVDIQALEEFSFEANPEDVSDSLLDLLKRYGVNRVSMGVQSLDNMELKKVGRRHSAEEALVALHRIRTRFDNYSVDIIFGLPGQTIETLSATIDTILCLMPPHISVYLLSYEPGTRLYAQLLTGKVEEISDDMAEAMYMLVNDRLTSAGYVHYEISNYSLPGYASRHNSAYWDFSTYLGLGVSAHSFTQNNRAYNPSDIKRYIQTINSGANSYIIDDETETERFNDWVIVSLRTAHGLDITNLQNWSPSIRKAFIRQLNDVEATGSVVRRGHIIVIPPEQWLTADAVMRQLIIVE